MKVAHVHPLQYCIKTFLICCFGVVAGAFQFPKIKFVGSLSTLKENDLNAPHRLVQNGIEESEKLRLKWKKYCTDSATRDTEDSIVNLLWEPHLRESYQVANAIFHVVASQSQTMHSSAYTVRLSFPSMKRPGDLDKLSQVLQSDKCKELLGVESVYAELYPTSPSPYIHIAFSIQATDCNNNEAVSNAMENVSDKTTAISATNNWVNDFIGKYRLCPYTTSSISRAAVGLSTVGIPAGSVHVVQVDGISDMATSNDDKAGAAKLVSAFWSEVVALMDSKQDEFATSLVICPEYDDDFISFANICDTIIQPTIVATQSTEFIGRAWFHPLYNTDAIGHSEVIAGHAVPHRMVNGFMTSLAKEDDGGEELLQYDDLVMANDLVRQTPHATINILRRSQLNAAAEYEENLGEKRPKANSIYVRNVRRLAKKMAIDDNII